MPVREDEIAVGKCYTLNGTRTNSSCRVTEISSSFVVTYQTRTETASGTKTEDSKSHSPSRGVDEAEGSLSLEEFTRAIVREVPCVPERAPGLSRP